MRLFFSDFVRLSFEIAQKGLLSRVKHGQSKKWDLLPTSTVGGSSSSEITITSFGLALARVFLSAGIVEFDGEGGLQETVKQGRVFGDIRIYISGQNKGLSQSTASCPAIFALQLGILA